MLVLSTSGLIDGDAVPGIQLVFNDQLITMRDGGQLWFDAYATPRCIYTSSSGGFKLTTSASSCATFTLLPLAGTASSDASQYYMLQNAATGTCTTIDAACSNRADTGGKECGKVRHMYLPLSLGSCSDGTAAAFRIETEADGCSAGATEWPNKKCFSES